MKRNHRVWVSGMLCVVGCGQELALPDGYGQPTARGGAGPADGVTGVGGSGGASGSSAAAPVKDPATVSKGGTGSSKGGGGAGGRAAEPSDAGDGGMGLAAGSAGESGGVTAPPPQLLFSEYIEGKKSDKALEIFALRGGSLQGCELQTFFNGKTEPTNLALEGELTTGAVYVLCSTELGKSRPCSRSTNLAFNGDDALALVCDGVVQDIIGEIGVDPGESWGMGATVDHTLQRRCEVSSGRSDPATPFVIDAEWVTFGVDTLSDLGQRVCEPLTGSTP